MLFLQEHWHYSAVRAGLAIAPGPATAAVFAVNAGRISRRVGRVVPAVAGASLMVASATYWIISTSGRPSYVVAALPGMLIGGASAGLTQAPLFAAAGTLPPDRSTTGSAVLNMARQVGSAVGVALVVVILGAGAAHTTAEFQHVWAAEAVAGALAAIAAASSGLRRRPASTRPSLRAEFWAVFAEPKSLPVSAGGTLDDSLLWHQPAVPGGRGRLVGLLVSAAATGRRAHRHPARGFRTHGFILKQFFAYRTRQEMTETSAGRKD